MNVVFGEKPNMIHIDEIDDKEERVFIVAHNPFGFDFLFMITNGEGSYAFMDKNFVVEHGKEYDRISELLDDYHMLGYEFWATTEVFEYHQQVASILQNNKVLNWKLTITPCSC